MGHDELCLGEAHQKIGEFMPAHGVEAGSRFIENKNFWFHCQRSGNWLRRFSPPLKGGAMSAILLASTARSAAFTRSSISPESSPRLAGPNATSSYGMHE